MAYGHEDCCMYPGSPCNCKMKDLPPPKLTKEGYVILSGLKRTFSREQKIENKLRRLLITLDEYEFHPNSSVAQAIKHAKEVLK